MKCNCTDVFIPIFIETHVLAMYLSDPRSGFSNLHMLHLIELYFQHKAIILKSYGTKTTSSHFSREYYTFINIFFFFFF